MHLEVKVAMGQAADYPISRLVRVANMRLFVPDRDLEEALHFTCATHDVQEKENIRDFLCQVTTSGRSRFLEQRSRIVSPDFRFPESVKKPHKSEPQMFSSTSIN